MRTKRIKAANVRIGDVVYGFGTVESIIHTSRASLDIYFENGDILIAYFDGCLVEIVTHNSNPVGN